MLTTWTVPPPPPPPDDSDVDALPPPAASLSSSPPQAASNMPPPLTAASAPADLPTNDLRVVGDSGPSGRSPSIVSVSRSIPSIPPRRVPLPGSAPLAFVPLSRDARTPATRRHRPMPSPASSCAGGRVVDRRGVPRDEEPLQRDHRQVEDEPEQREAEDHREQPPGLEVVQARDDLVAEPLVAAEVLTDDGADDREDDRDLHPRQDVGQGARVLEPAERLPPARIEALHHVLLPLVHGADAEDRVQQHGEERDHRDDDDLGRDPEAEPDDEQRDQRDLRHHLRGDDDRSHRLLEPLDPAEQRAEADAEHDRDREAHERLVERHPHVGPEAVLLDEIPHAAHDLLGLGQHERRHVEEGDDELPDDHQYDDGPDRADPRDQPARSRAHSLTPPWRATRSSSSISWWRRLTT